MTTDVAAPTTYSKRDVELEAIRDARSRTYDPQAKVRNQAVRELCPCQLRADYPQVWDRLLQMTVDPDVKVRSNVLHVLADGSPHHRERDVLRAVESMQNDPDSHLRRRVRGLLTQYRRTGRINVL